MGTTAGTAGSSASTGGRGSRRLPATDEAPPGERSEPCIADAGETPSRRVAQMHGDSRIAWMLAIPRNSSAGVLVGLRVGAASAPLVAASSALGPRLLHAAAVLLIPWRPRNRQRVSGLERCDRDTLVPFPMAAFALALMNGRASTMRSMGACDEATA